MFFILEKVLLTEKEVYDYNDERLVSEGGNAEVSDIGLKVEAKKANEST